MKLLVFVCVATQFIAANSEIIGESLEPCQKSAPSYRECLLKALIKLIPYGFTGNKYRIPKMDPLDLPVLGFERNLNEIGTVKVNMKNFRLLGLSNFINDYVTLNVKNFSGEIKLNHPYLYVSTDYTFDGQLFTVPLVSQGHFTANFTDVTSSIRVSFNPVKKVGGKYYTVNKLKIQNKVGEGFIKMTSQNPQYQEMTDYISHFLNRNSKQLLDIINPIYVETIEDMLRSMLETNLKLVSADGLLAE